MKPLNRDAASLLEAVAGEAADEPTAVDRARVKHALAARLAIAAGASASTVGLGTAEAAKLAVLTKLLLPAATVGMLTAGGGYYAYEVYHRPDARAASQPAQPLRPRMHVETESQPRARRAPRQGTVPGASVAGSHVAADAQRRERRADTALAPADAADPSVHGGAARESKPSSADATSERGRAPAKGTLEAETQLLRQVHADIREGDARQALARLGEYDRQFGQGALRAEHQAARVMTLCQLGDKHRARAEAQRFLERWPNSPLVPRVRDACRDP